MSKEHVKCSKGVRGKMSDRVCRKILKWFGRVKNIRKERLIRRNVRVRCGEKRLGASSSLDSWIESKRHAVHGRCSWRRQTWNVRIESSWFFVLWTQPERISLNQVRFLTQSFRKVCSGVSDDSFTEIMGGSKL